MHWRQIQKNNIRDWKKFADFLGLDDEKRKAILQKCSFPLNIPRRLAEKIEKGSLKDPILKQFLPTKKELISNPQFTLDPTEEKSFQITPKLLKKYPHRALILTTNACGMHCRFCFRRHYDYKIGGGFSKEIEEIAKDPSLFEIILSGGDPLSLSDPVLHALLEDLSQISHVKMIRFHTRFPLGIPERITEDLIKTLKKIPQQIVFVLHSNHPREYDADVFFHLDKLRKIGVVLLNQAVLLKGINDDVETLKDLSETLIQGGIIPYYLHQLDPIDGGGHFHVDKEKGLKLIKELREKLPGYGVPQYVQEVPHRQSKTPLHDELHMI